MRRAAPLCRCSGMTSPTIRRSDGLSRAELSAKVTWATGAPATGDGAAGAAGIVLGGGRAATCAAGAELAAPLAWDLPLWASAGAGGGGRDASGSGRLLTVGLVSGDSRGWPPASTVGGGAASSVVGPGDCESPVGGGAVSDSQDDDPLELDVAGAV